MKAAALLQRCALPLLFFALTVVRFGYQTIDEESYIILRYAKNLVDGYGFVWNPGEAPLWGSTSLLWTLILATAAALTGVSLPVVAQILGVVLSATLIIVVCSTCPDWTTASVVGSFLGVSTLAGHALIGMDVVLFSLLLLLTYVNRNDWRKLLIFSVLMTITRPEGALVALAFVVVHYYQNRNHKLPVLFGAVSCVVLLVLFLYFGEIVPNPYYVKVGFPDVERNFRSGLRALTMVQGLLPTVLLAAYLLHSERELTKTTIMALLPVGLYYAAYLGVYQSQNILGRFQFPVIPVLLVASVPAMRWLFRQPKTRLQVLVFVCLFGLLLAAEYNDTATVLGPNIEDQNRALMGQALGEVPNHTMAVTDAGMVPYYSEWRVIDILGLNDRTIARNGLDLEYLGSIDIQLFMMGWDGSLDNVLNDSNGILDNAHLISLNYFLEQRNFSLACSVPYTIDTGRLSYYFIAPSFEGRDAVVQALCTANVPYVYNMLGGGEI